MTSLSHDFLKRCEAVEPIARRCWASSLLGVRRDRGPVLAATHSSGQADYATGDDYRYVDWNRAARLDELVSRQHRGVETGVVELVLDRSASMTIGLPTKFAFAQQLAAALGYFALAAGRNVRVASPERNDAGATFHGGRNAAALIHAVEALSPSNDKATLKPELISVARRLRRGDIAVVLSDLLNPEGLIPLIAPLARPAEQLLIVQVLAAEDIDPRCLHRVRLCDVESGSALAMELEEEDLATYREAAAEFCRGLRRDCLVRGIALVQLRTDAGFDLALEHLIQVAAMHAARQN